MINNKRLSIIIPAYNLEKYIQYCVLSILEQNEDVECIVIDDGSEDKTYDICKEIQRKYERLILIHQKNCGAAEARNRGIKEASGDWVMFVDGDDYMTPGSIRYILSCVNTIKADFFLWAHQNERKNHSIIEQYVFQDAEEINRFDNNVKFFIEHIFQKEHGEKSVNMVHPFAKCFSKAIIEQNNLYFERLEVGEDTLFIYRYLMCVKRCNADNHIIYNRRFRRTSTINSKSSKKANEILTFIKKMEAELIKNECAYAVSHICYLYFFKIMSTALKTLSDRKSVRQSIRLINKFINAPEVLEILQHIDMSKLKGKDKIKFFLFKHHLSYLLFIIYGD